MEPLAKPRNEREIIQEIIAGLTPEIINRAYPPNERFERMAKEHELRELEKKSTIVDSNSRKEFEREVATIRATSNSFNTQVRRLQNDPLNDIFEELVRKAKYQDLNKRLAEQSRSTIRARQSYPR